MEQDVGPPEFEARKGESAGVVVRGVHRTLTECELPCGIPRLCIAIVQVGGAEDKASCPCNTEVERGMVPLSRNQVVFVVGCGDRPNEELFVGAHQLEADAPGVGWVRIVDRGLKFNGLRIRIDGFEDRSRLMRCPEPEGEGGRVSNVGLSGVGGGQFVGRRERIETQGIAIGAIGHQIAECHSGGRGQVAASTTDGEVIDAFVYLRGEVLDAVHIFHATVVVHGEVAGEVGGIGLTN